MKKFSIKITDNVDLKNWLKGVAINVSVWGGLLLLFTYLLSFIGFLEPITEPILTSGLYLAVAVVGVYFIIVAWFLLLALVELAKELPTALADFFTSRDKIRGAIAWIVGLSVSFFLIFSLSDLSDAFDVGGYPTESEDEGTSLYGAWGAIFIFSLMMGTRCGLAIYEKSIHGGFDDKAQIQFNMWLIGIIAFGVSVAIKDFIFGYNNSYLELLNFFIGGIILAVLYPRYNSKVSKLSDDKT